MNDPDYRMPFLVGAGVIAGLFFGKAAYDHMFVEGLTDEERKGIFLAAATVILGYGATKLVNLDEYWWLTTESAAKKAEASVR